MFFWTAAFEGLHQKYTDFFFIKLIYNSLGTDIDDILLNVFVFKLGKLYLNLIFYKYTLLWQL